ncbi:MAG: hypothetical protein HEQ16_04960 [Bosea sp.]|nr:hypothetical protein [Bosea sp. (in: a-proteobacteria)]
MIPDLAPFTFVRASSGLLLTPDRSALLAPFADNAQRRDAARGLRIETGAMNRALNNQTLSGSNTFVGGAATHAIALNAEAAPDGTLRAARATYGGASGSGHFRVPCSGLVNGAVYAVGAFIRPVAMTGLTLLSVDVGDGATTSGNSISQLVPGEWRWVSFTGAIAGAQQWVDFNLVGNPSAVWVFHIWMPQVTDVPTSPIITGAGPIARAIESLAAPLPLPVAHTMIVMGRSAAFTGSVENQELVRHNSPSLGPRIIRFPDRTLAAGGLGAASQNLGILSDNTLFCAAYTTDAAGTAASANGGTVINSSTPADGSTTSTLQIGAQNPGGGSAWNGDIERVIVLPRRVPNAELQALATRATYGG